MKETLVGGTTCSGAAAVTAQCVLQCCAGACGQAQVSTGLTALELPPEQAAPVRTGPDALTRSCA